MTPIRFSLTSLIRFAFSGATFFGTKRETRQNQDPKADRKAPPGCESDCGYGVEQVTTRDSRVKSFLLRPFNRNPLGLNRGQPLNRKRHHQIKRSLLLRIGGTMRKQ